MAGLFCGGHFCCRPTPGQVSHALGGVFLVHRSCGDATAVARAVGAAISSKDKRYGSLQHKQARVKLVRVRATMHVWFDFARAKLIAFAPKVGFKLGSIHPAFTFRNI
jgi:hypothetical protein